jgi:Tol biopolymer transport system component
MDPDGHNKRDISQGPEGFAYGFSASPDGALVAYHKDYQVYIADADGSNPRKVETGQPFNFGPQWSPDGKWILFVCGEHYKNDLYVVKRDGTGLRKLASREGYKGAVDVFDVYDFHEGSSDGPAWSPDGAWVFYTARVGDANELMRANLEGKTEQLTHGPAGTGNYHPRVSPDGNWVVFGSNRTGIRQLYVIRAAGSEPYPSTSVGEGWGAMWASWQPPQ